MAHGQLGSVIAFLRRTFAPTDTGDQSDRQLLRRFVDHKDQDAFTALLRRHGPMVLAVCRRVLNDGADVDDAFQATFVILSRKAAAGGWHDSVGSWLYQVAYRVAAKGADAAGRRRRRESQVRDMTPDDKLSFADRSELRAVLDDELSRLPEKYRAPLVLCYLEGKTNEEAASLLGWTRGTVSGRLARAHDLLRGRLARRGLALSTAALVPFLGESTATAAVPAALFEATTQVVALSAAGALPAPVATLVEGVLTTMYATKCKIAAVWLLVLGLLGGSTGVYYYQRAHGDDAQDPVVQKAVPKAEPEAEPDSDQPVVKEAKAGRVEKKKEARPAVEQVKSKAVRVNGVDFEIVADKVWTIPDKGEKQTVEIALRITNSGEKDLTFRIWELPRVILKTADGKDVKFHFARDATAPATKLRVAAGKTEEVSRMGELQWTKEGKNLQFAGNDDSGGLWWFDNFEAGKYTVSLYYESSETKVDSWNGQFYTKTVEVEVKKAAR